MLKFVEKNKKLLLLIATCVIALAWLCTAPMLFIKVATAGNAHVLSYVRMILRELVAGLAMIAFAVGGFLYWKQGKQFFMLPAGGALGVCAFGIELIMALIQAFVYSQASVFFEAFGAAVIPCLLFAFIVVFSFIKIKGPVVPIIGGAAGAWMALTSFFGGFAGLIDYLRIADMLNQSGFVKFLRGCGELLIGGGMMLFYLGLAVLVFLFLWERCNPAEESVQEAAAEAEEV